MSMPDTPDTGMIQIERAQLQNILDLAAGSLDWGSDFWSTEDTACARHIAVLLGVNPMVVTPSSHRRTYAHAWTEAPSWMRDKDACLWCSRRRDETPHIPAGGVS